MGTTPLPTMPSWRCNRAAPMTAVPTICGRSNNTETTCGRCRCLRLREPTALSRCPFPSFRSRSSNSITQQANTASSAACRRLAMRLWYSGELTAEMF